MIKTFCDLCETEIRDFKDSRYSVKIDKIIGTTTTFREYECLVCENCEKKIVNFIDLLRGDNEHNN